MQRQIEPGLSKERSRNRTAEARLLELLLMADQKRHSLVHTIQPRSKLLEPVALSYAQERLWFLDKVGLVGEAYNVVVALRLTGELVNDAVERSLAEIVRRHESLRTRFESANGMVYQVIGRPGTFRLRRMKTGRATSEGRELELLEYARNEQSHRFDLSAGPMFRATLVELDKEDHALLLTIHHAACDGWSLGVLLAELGTLYGSYCRGESSPLEEPRLQYADYALWQRQWPRDVLEKQLQFWRKQLAGASPQLKLPTDRSRPPIESFRGAVLKIDLPAALASALEGLGRSTRCTLFMVFLAAYQVLLSRWSGQHDILVGAPIAGRNKQETEGLIGLFVNTLVLRTDLTEDLTFRELLHRVKETTLNAYAHQDIPFEAVVRELRPDRDLAQQPLFQVSIVMQNYPEPQVELPGLSCSWIDTGAAHTHFDLTLHVHEESQGISAAFQYATDLFDEDTIKRMAASFQAILRAMVEDVSRSVHKTGLLSTLEARQLLVDWNATSVRYPRGDLLHQLFEAEVVRTPHEFALEYEQQRLTFDDLNRRANQLARHLRKHGVGPDSLVILYLCRGVDVLVALIAVLKAGGAYVPVDPNNPVERVRHIMVDAQPKVILTQRALIGSLPSTSTKVLLIDADDGRIDAEPKENLDSHAEGLRADHLAYVIYTSGSTGTAKGVMVEHRSVVNYVHHAIRQFDVPSGNGSLVCTSISFDLMLTGLYPPLLCGRTVRMCSELSAAALADQLQACSNLAPLKLTPSHLPFLENALVGGMLTGKVRALVLGGESLPPEAARLWRQHAPSTRIINHYGPTETTIGCLTYEIDETSPSKVPVGRPIANVQAYILDGCMQPVPIGVAGDIYIGGAGVSRGYRHRPGLTAEKFIADPFSRSNGSRIYRTGDVGRWNAQGAIEYVGRKDGQLKLRGYRIELGEIEAQLRTAERVKEAAAIVREDGSGEKYIAAYLTTRDGPEITVEEVRNHLKSKLPDYMIPRAFMIVGSLPLTANGKLDTSSLPALSSDAFGKGGYDPPIGEIETALASIWQELLQVERVGRRDNFFELGGYSLLGLRLTSAVAEHFAVDLSVIAVFKHPTIVQLAEHIALERSDAQESEAQHRDQVEEGTI